MSVPFVLYILLMFVFGNLVRMKITTDGLVIKTRLYYILVVDVVRRVKDKYLRFVVFIVFI